jgi:hypothetical protein
MFSLAGAPTGPATLLFLECKDSLGPLSKRRLSGHLRIGRASVRRFLRGFAALSPACAVETSLFGRRMAVHDAGRLHLSRSIAGLSAPMTGLRRSKLLREVSRELPPIPRIRLARRMKGLTSYNRI